MKSVVAGLAALLVSIFALHAQESAPTAIPAASTPTAASDVIDAANLDALRAKAGTDAVVEGVVTKVGTTKEGGITFINLGLPAKQGFVAVIFKSDYTAFPDGFDKYKTQKVRVTGKVELYRSETPEIKIKTPDQITIVTQ